jgi:hypothetical protein
MKMKVHKVPLSTIIIYVIVAVKASNSQRDVDIIALDAVLLFVISMERLRIPTLFHVKYLEIAYVIAV